MSDNGMPKFRGRVSQKKINRLKASESEFIRLIRDNKALRTDARTVRARIERSSDHHIDAHPELVTELMRTHGIPAKYRAEIEQLIATGTTQQRRLETGYPEVVRTDREVYVILTPKTDLNDPGVQTYIRVVLSVGREVIPQPLQSGRVKDWRPTWEWSLKHPEVSYKEIAETLGVNETTVKRRFGVLNAAHGTPKRKHATK